MASFYNLSQRISGYVVRVNKAERGRKLVLKRVFSVNEYDSAMSFTDEMEDRYGRGYIVSFDTMFR